jgi:hypothetical protein
MRRWIAGRIVLLPWRISMPLYRHREPNFKLLEYECNAYLEDAANRAK